MLANGTITPWTPEVSIFTTDTARVGYAFIAVGAIALLLILMSLPDNKFGVLVHNRVVARFPNLTLLVAFVGLLVGLVCVFGFSQFEKGDAIVESHDEQFQTHMRDIYGIKNIDGKIRSLSSESKPGDNQMFVTYTDSTEGLLVYKYDGKKIDYRFLPVTAAEGL